MTAAEVPNTAPLRVALVGAGEWGRVHARMFAERPDVRVVAVVGRTAERTAARAAQLGARPYTNLAEMLDRERPDLVSVSLPNQAHFAPTLEVVRAGVPLLVEKPLVFDLAEADRLIAEARARGLFFAVNFNHRYARPALLAARAIAEGRVGDVVFATWRFGGEGASDHPFANLVETQCHGFDLLEHLCGPVESVMAEMTDRTGGGFRTLVVALRFASGAVGSLVGTYDSSYAYPGTQQLEVNGTLGRVTVTDTVRRFTYHAAGSEVGEVWEAGYFNDRAREFTRTADAYLDSMLAAFRRGDPPPVPAEAGRRALLLADACIRSFREGRRVSVSSEEGQERGGDDGGTGG